MSEQVAFFKSHQDWRRDKPASIITRKQARELLDSGDYYSVNHGNAVAEVPANARQPKQEFISTGWRIAGQTQMGNRFRLPSGPGFPHLVLS